MARFTGLFLGSGFLKSLLEEGGLQAVFMRDGRCSSCKNIFSVVSSPHPLATAHHSNDRGTLVKLCFRGGTAIPMEEGR